MLQITDKSIDEATVLAAVKTPAAGAVVLFLGTTREFTAHDSDVKQTTRLEYECYPDMAIAELEKLVSSTREKWNVEKIAIVHRVGLVPLAETSVAIAVSSAHRPEAFEAGRWLLDTLKEQVPIWKKENWSDGTTDWVHPEQNAGKVVDSITDGSATTS